MEEQKNKVESSLSERLLKERSDNQPVYTISEDSLQLLLNMVQEGFTEFPEELLQKVSIRDLLNALKKAHGVYLNTKLPEIEQSIYNLYSKQTNSDNVLLMLCGFFISYQKKLVAHIQYEEVFLFPYIQA